MKQVDITISREDSDLFDQIIADNDWAWLYDTGHITPSERRWRTIPMKAEEITDLYDALDMELTNFEFYPF